MKRHGVRAVPERACSMLLQDASPMNRLDRSPLHGSVVALALTAIALIITLLLRPHLEPDLFLFFEVAVWLSAWYYGLTVGLLATMTSAAALAYVFHTSGTSLT